MRKSKSDFTTHTELYVKSIELHKIHPILADPPPLTAGHERITTQIVPSLLEYSRPTVIASEALLPVPPFPVADPSYIPFLDTLDIYPRTSVSRNMFLHVL